MRSVWKFFAGSFLCGFLSVLSAAPQGWTESCPDDLKRLSKEGNRPIFLFFTGSDWCPACIRMQDSVLASKEFRAYAEKNNLLLAWADFPRLVPCPPPIAQRNEELMQSLLGNRDEIRFPAMLLLAPDGRIIGRIDGAVSLSFLLAQLEEWKNQPPLFFAVTDRDAVRTKQLLKTGAKADTASALTGRTVLMEAAARKGSDDVIRELISAGAEINRADADGMTALHYAARAANRSALEILLKCKADPNLLTKDGLPPLFFAIRRGDRFCTELLLKNGADPNVSLPEEGRSLAACAVIDARQDILRMLVQYGASLQARDAEGNTLLHYAAAIGDQGMILFFLSRNLSPAIRNNRGKLPADYTSDQKLKLLLTPKQTDTRTNSAPSQEKKDNKKK